MDITRERQPAKARPAPRPRPRPQLPLFGERVEIARWLAEGERLSETYGARMAAAMAAAKRAFLPQAGPVLRFLEEACETRNAAAAVAADSGSYEFSAKLFARYLEWCRSSGRPAMTLTAFGRCLSALGFPVMRMGARRNKARIGLKLKDA